MNTTNTMDRLVEKALNEGQIIEIGCSGDCGQSHVNALYPREAMEKFAIEKQQWKKGHRRYYAPESDHITLRVKFTETKTEFYRDAGDTSTDQYIVGEIISLIANGITHPDWKGVQIKIPKNSTEELPILLEFKEVKGKWFNSFTYVTNRI